MCFALHKNVHAPWRKTDILYSCRHSIASSIWTKNESHAKQLVKN